MPEAILDRYFIYVSVLLGGIFTEEDKDKDTECQTLFQICVLITLAHEQYPVNQDYLEVVIESWKKLKAKKIDCKRASICIAI